MEFYQSAKWKALVIIPKITATLSIVGSSLIIRDVFRKENRRKRLKVTTNRIVALMSILDVMYSFVSPFLGTWMIPKESGAWGATGNQGSCIFQGSLSFLLSGATTGLNAALALTYILIVRCGWKDEKLQTPFMSFVLLGIPVLARLGMVIWSLIDQAFNWGGLNVCHIHSAPLGCSESGDPYPCERGTHAPNIQLATIIWNQTCFAMILISTVTLYWTVLQKERATDRYAVDESQRNRRHSKRVAMQGILYAGSFFLTWIFWLISFFLGVAKRPKPYGLIIMMAISIPMQGFWNAIVYFRPRFINKNERNGRNSLSSLRQSFLARRGIGFFRSSRFGKKMSSDTIGINEMTASSPRRVSNDEDEFNNDEEKMEEGKGPFPNEVP